jgi:hypothetical protein
MTASSAVLRPSPDVIFRELEGEAVLLDLASGRYFGLNAVGTRIWMLLESGSTVAAAAAALAAEFEADAEQIARDVDELVAELSARGLLVAPPAADAPRR